MSEKTYQYPQNRNYRQYGWRVRNVHSSKYGRIYAVIERPLAGDYVVGRGFNTHDGSWAQGEYGYHSRQKANNRAKYLARIYLYKK